MKGKFVLIVLLISVGILAAVEAGSALQRGAVGRGGQPNAAAVSTASILILGAGTPQITADRSGTSIGIIVNGTVYIFDAGAGVERRMLEARAKANNTITTFGPVFISHLHSDHTLGLPAMLYYDRPMNQPFTLFGPPGLKKMMDNIVAAWSEDRDIRIKGGEGANPVRWQTNVTEVTSGVAFKDANVTVTAFEVPHGSWEHALGYRIDTTSRSIVISGDTSASNAIVEHCNGCDVLIHEVGESGAGPGGDYMKRYHTSPSELADIATRSKAKMLILYHPALRNPPAQVIREIMNTYHGPVFLARDLDIY